MRKSTLVVVLLALLFVVGIVASPSGSRPPCWSKHGTCPTTSTTVPSTTTTVPSTTTTVPTTTVTDPGPSGVPVPVGDLPGWHLIYSDDFTQSVPLGSFYSAVSGKWQAYPYNWPGTPTWGTYDPAGTTSFHDGMQDIWLHTSSGTVATDPAPAGTHEIAANEPEPNGPAADGCGTCLALMYGRVAVRYRTDSFGYYKPSWLLWPISETWPRDGEIDFPEQGQFSDSQVCAFMHRQDGTSGGDQDAYCVNGYDTTQWHTAVIEWTATHVRFILDGVVIGDSTSRIPNTPMRYVLQNGGSFNTGVAPDAAQGHVYIDWVAIYSPT